MTQKSNYEIFLDTVECLKTSQGFYSRIDKTLHEMSEEAKEEVKQTLNSQPQWSNQIDCILYLEQ